MGQYSGILLIVIMFVVMYFLMIRPQRKQQQKHQDTLSKLQKGDHVITIGRLHGVVDEINEEDKTVTIDADGVYLVFDLRAIAQVTQKSASAAVAEDVQKPEEAKTEETVESSDDDVEKTTDAEADKAADADTTK